MKLIRQSIEQICRGQSLGFLLRGVHQDQGINKPFSEIPVANQFSLLGLLNNIFKHKESVKYIHKDWLKMQKKYGNIFKKRIYPGAEYTVFCCSPEDNFSMFHADGRTPIRDNLENMVHVRNSLDLPLGLMNENGENWKRLRSITNKYMLDDENVWRYTHMQHEETLKLLDHIEKNLDENKEFDNFLPLLHKWAFDMTGIFALNSKLNCLNGNENDHAHKMISCTMQMFDLVAKTLFSSKLWKYYDTNDIKALKKAQIQQLQLAKHFITTQSQPNKQNDLVGYIMNHSHIHNNEKLLLISDLLLAGIDTTANAAVFVVYCLAANPKCQAILREEIATITKMTGVTGEALKKMKYMKSCIKETERMFPFVTSLSRRANCDLVLSGYSVPQGTNILNISNIVNNYNEEFFEDSLRFKPERWTCKKLNKNRGMIFTGSFGMGARKCLGRKFAVQEMQILLISLFGKYEISYEHNPIELIFSLVSCPSKSPKFKFTKL